MMPDAGYPVCLFGCVLLSFRCILFGLFEVSSPVASYTKVAEFGLVFLSILAFLSLVPFFIPWPDA